MNKHKTINKGDIIFKQGNFSDSAFIVTKGTFEISIGDNKFGNQKKVLSRLYQNEIFGEMGLIDGLSRSATATALEDGQISILSKENYETMARQNPRLLLPLFKILSLRIRNTLGVLKNTPKSSNPQTWG